MRLTLSRSPSLIYKRGLLLSYLCPSLVAGGLADPLLPPTLDCLPTYSHTHLLEGSRSASRVRC